LGQGAVVVGELASAGGLGVGEEFVDPEISDIFIGIDKIFIVPEERAGEAWEIEEKTDEGKDE